MFLMTIKARSVSMVSRYNTPCVFDIGLLRAHLISEGLAVLRPTIPPVYISNDYIPCSILVQSSINEIHGIFKADL